MPERLARLVSAIVPCADSALEARVRARLDNLTKPRGSLGRLEDVALQYCLVRGQEQPPLPRAALCVFCADHGVTAEGVSAYPAEVTAQMVGNFAAGGAAVSVLAKHLGVDSQIVDVGVNSPHRFNPPVLDRRVRNGTRNFAREDAMTADEAFEAIETGAACAEELAGEGDCLLVGGEMGIGNTTAATAVCAGLLTAPPESLTGYGAGLDEAGRRKKAQVIEQALAARQPDRDDAFDTLRKVGGLEIAALAGFFLAGAGHRTLAIVDGFIATAAALAAVRLAPAVRDYLVFAHRSAEAGHGAALEALDARPLFDLGMRLGEGTGAALAVEMVRAAVRLYREMATFEAAGVSR